MSYILGVSVYSGYKTPDTLKNYVLEKVMTMSGNEVKIRNVKVMKHYPKATAGAQPSPADMKKCLFFSRR